MKDSPTLAQGSEPLLLTQPVPYGIYQGTDIALETGAKPVEKLGAGDMVITRDGPQKLRENLLMLRRRAGSSRTWPITVPAQALNNKKRFLVPYDARLVVQGAPVFEMTGQPAVAVRAENLIGYKGIARGAIVARLSCFQMTFEKPTVITVAGGAELDILSQKGSANYALLGQVETRELCRRLDGLNFQSRRGAKSNMDWI